MKAEDLGPLAVKVTPRNPGFSVMGCATAVVKGRRVRHCIVKQFTAQPTPADLSTFATSATADLVTWFTSQEQF